MPTLAEIVGHKEGQCNCGLCELTAEEKQAVEQITLKRQREHEERLLTLGDD